jgi:hypothetical protein
MNSLSFSVCFRFFIVEFQRKSDHTANFIFLDCWLSDATLELFRKLGRGAETTLPERKPAAANKYVSL